jgi:CheY-like chemotaxis protein
MLRIYDRALEVITVRDGESALALMEDVPPDLVVLDVVMPGMDGWQVLAQMAAENVIRDIPVIVVSAQDPHLDAPSAPFLIASYGKGLSIASLLRCSLSLSSVLLNTGQGPEPMRP